MHPVVGSTDENPNGERNRVVSSGNTNERLVALLTGGGDPHYAQGLAMSITKAGMLVDFIGSDSLDDACLRENANIRFLNLRGDQSEDVSLLAKVQRLWRYYIRLIVYAKRSDARIFHILWNNRVEYFDRTLLMLFYRLCGRQVVLTVHNVNAAMRDGHDSWLNRRTLNVQYSLCRFLFVHTEKMKAELERDFSVSPEKIIVIPFGLNEATPHTGLSSAQARQELGIVFDELVLLFFGQIAPYKGLHHLIDAFPAINRELPSSRLLIAGKIKPGSEDYWQQCLELLGSMECKDRVQTRIEFVPDREVEVYFKAADALVLPYLRIFQSGLPFLALSYGLPVLTTNAGSLVDLVVPGETGFVCESGNPEELVSMIVGFADSPLFSGLSSRREKIAKLAKKQHSWDKVAEITRGVYRQLVSCTGN